jgi:glutathione S-transferase
MKFYFDLLSQPSRALFIFLKMNKIPFEPMVTKLARREHLTESFKEVNRFQRLPCIDDNGFKLAESVAIFRYIAAKNPELVADNWYPKDLQERAKVDEYLEWQHLGTRAACAGYVRTVFMTPLMKFNYKLNPKKTEAAKGVLVKTLDTFENLWLEDPSKPFLATKEISFADVLASCEIDMLPLVNFNALVTFYCSLFYFKILCTKSENYKLFLSISHVVSTLLKCLPKALQFYENFLI